MITNCPHCGQKVKVGDPGKYRCPQCSAIFEAQVPEAKPVEERPFDDSDHGHFHPHGPESEDMYVSLPDLDQNDASDLYVDAEEAASACELCGRPGAGSICKECGKFVCSSCVVRETGQPVCPECADNILRRAEVEIRHRREMTPDPEMANSVFAKVKLILMDPGRFFSHPIPKESTFSVLAYAVIFYCLGGIFALAYGLSTMRQTLDSMDAKTRALFSIIPFEEILSNPSQIFIIGSILLPIMSIAALGFVAILLHLMLMFFGRPNGGFYQTVRVIAYSNVTHLFYIIPGIGGMLCFFWQLWIVIVGASRVHHMTTTRTAAAVVMPMVLIVFALVALSFMYALSVM